MTQPGQSDFKLTIRSASGQEREAMEGIVGPLGSDACVLVYVGPHLAGWGDDYGTFHPYMEGASRDKGGDALLAAAVAVWESVQ